jgi:uncharacterized low-complexity protein
LTQYPFSIPYHLTGSANSRPSESAPKSIAFNYIADPFDPASSAAVSDIMAPNNDAPKATDKGKGKAVEGKADEGKKGKDSQLPTNGKKDDSKVDDGKRLSPTQSGSAILASQVN